MTKLSAMFEDVLLPSDPAENTSSTRATLVRLPLSAAVRSKFMTHFQTNLSGQYSEASLTSIPLHGGYVLGCASDRFIRNKLGLQGENKDLDWCILLKKWGAIEAQVLASDDFMRLLDSRSIPTTKIVQPRMFLSPNVDASKPRVSKQSTTGISSRLAVNAKAAIDWHLDERGANVVAAWKKFLNKNPDSTDLPWKDMIVGHLDTGYIPHEALAWNSSTSTTILHKKGYDYYAMPRDNDPQDPWLSGFPGHGTRIDGAIAGFDPRNVSHPFYGSAPGLKIIPYRVTDSVIADHVQDHIANAIDQAIKDGCHIITICLGALRGDRRVASAIDRAYEHGVIVVCAAGQVWPWVIYPGRFNRVMTVSGIGPTSVPWGSAASGECVDWCAPADEIRRLNVTPKSGGFETGINPKVDGNGTSYATAVTSGIAAMWLAWHGVADLRAKYAGQEWMIPAAFKKLVKVSCKKWPLNSSGSVGYGVGVIDAFALLNQPLPSANSMNKEALADDPFDSNH